MVLAVAWVAHPTGIGLVVVAIFLGAAVLSAVHHTEVVAHKVLFGLPSLFSLPNENWRFHGHTHPWKRQKT